MIGSVNEVATALVVSFIISLGVSLKGQDTQKRLLEDNIQVTKDLSKAVSDLKVEIAVFAERYATKDDLDRKVMKGAPNGS